MSLLTKYRPTQFSEVIGQDAVVKSLEAAIERKAGKTFLFTGPSGVGKTTLARIAAGVLGCDRPQEIDAATHTGVEEMRNVCDGLAYLPLGEGSIKAVIVDECHMLSKNAWNSLLKILEHPPAHVYWFLCTTEAGKVIKTIMTRCLRYELKPVGRNDLIDLLDNILDEEKLNLGKEEESILDLCVKEADGSPRQAIANLAVCLTAKTRKEAANLLLTAEGTKEGIDFVRALYNGASWSQLQGLISDIGDVNAESVRQMVRAYGTKIVLGASNTDVAGRALEVLDAFSTPFNDRDGITPVVLAVGQLKLGE